MERPCGTCTVCCTVLGLRRKNGERISLPYQPCPKACSKKSLFNGGGCSIWKSKPEACNNFECAWKQGGLPPSTQYRPDKFGLMMSMSRWGDARKEDPVIKGHVVLIHEVHKGAIKANKDFIKEMTSICSDRRKSGRRADAICVVHSDKTKEITVFSKELSDALTEEGVSLETE